MPRVGWSAMSSTRSRLNSRATMTFCWLPPDSVAAATQPDGVRMSNCGMSSLARLRDCLLVDHPEPRERWVVVLGQDEVVLDREGQHQPVALAIAGNIGDAALGQVARRVVRHVLVDQSDGAAGGSSQAVERLDELGLAVPGDAGDAKDLARTDLEAAPVDDRRAAIVGDAQVLDAQDDVAGLAGPLSTMSDTSRPTIISARSSSVAVFGSACPTTLPRRMTVIRSAISRTSYSLWLMNTMLVPSAARRRRTAKISTVSWGVRTAVGSSRMRTLAPR